MGQDEQGITIVGDDPRQSRVELAQLYKWGIGALTGLVMFFGGLYISDAAANQRAQAAQLLAHEQRLTTLEESKRNTEELLREIKAELRRIANAVVK